jgi:hypothetical protein
MVSDATAQIRVALQHSGGGWSRRTTRTYRRGSGSMPGNPSVNCAPQRRDRAPGVPRTASAAARYATHPAGALAPGRPLLPEQTSQGPEPRPAFDDPSYELSLTLKD